jgi:hypothetical protein
VGEMDEEKSLIAIKGILLVGEEVAIVPALAIIGAAAAVTGIGVGGYYLSRVIFKREIKQLKKAV